MSNIKLIKFNLDVETLIMKSILNILKQIERFLGELCPELVWDLLGVLYFRGTRSYADLNRDRHIQSPEC